MAAVFLIFWLILGTRGSPIGKNAENDDVRAVHEHTEDDLNVEGSEPFRYPYQDWRTPADNYRNFIKAVPQTNLQPPPVFQGPKPSSPVSSSFKPSPPDFRNFQLPLQYLPLSGNKLGSLNASPYQYRSSPVPQKYAPFSSQCTDPYLLHLMVNYMRAVGYGIGPQGFYGSTGVPAPKPPGVFRDIEKADQ